jgi:hypothetical protein
MMTILGKLDQKLRVSIENKAAPPRNGRVS